MNENDKIKNRYEFVLLFDATNCNPNGDPDAGNMPRIDSETQRGLVTDVCIKRKIRNRIQIRTINNNDLNKNNYDIFIKEKAVLNNLIKEAYDSLETKSEKKTVTSFEAQKFMCEKYYDVRTFGAVMSTGSKEDSKNDSEFENDNTEIDETKKKKEKIDKSKKSKNAGQVKGPIQLSFATSISPIYEHPHCLTRCAVTKEADIDKEQTMGRKYTIPYGLYRAHGYISAFRANETGFSKKDLQIFWEALLNMFEEDSSSSHSGMTVCALYVFKHSSQLGNMYAADVFDSVEITETENKPPRSFRDYKVTLKTEKLGDKVNFLRYRDRWNPELENTVEDPTIAEESKG